MDEKMKIAIKNDPIVKMTTRTCKQTLSRKHQLANLITEQHVKKMRKKRLGVTKIDDDKQHSLFAKLKHPNESKLGAKPLEI